MDDMAGYSEVPLDLSRIPSVEQGIADAGVRYRRFGEFGLRAMGRPPDAPMFVTHFALLSFVNRAASLHSGIVSAVRGTNPHVAFTLLRAYLELVVLVRYVDRDPDYILELEKPRPKGKRKRFRDLFEDAAPELRGVLRVYDNLNEIAHFGATALWHPFQAEDEMRMSFSTGPDWHRPDEDKTVLAMLLEADEVVLEMLERFASHHIDPLVEDFHAWRRAGHAVVRSLGGEVASLGADHWLTVPPSAMQEAVERGLAAWCEEHQVFEKTRGVPPEEFEAWAAERAATHDGPEPS